MCGIAGWAGPMDLDETVLERMCGAIRHRGPDDAGTFVAPGRAGLGFRRLSIIDLDGGAQPLRDEHGAVTVTCNGEIYNFRALRERLEAAGHSFGSRSDCETIVHLYEDEGTDAVESLHGMFAIALWDPRRDRLVLARDRLGVKPLYYAEVGGGILYGSEPGAILASGLVEARPDPEALVEYLTLQYVPAPRSGFAGIRKLAPGEMLIFERGRARVVRYWELRHAPGEEPGSDAEILERLDALLQDATESRLVADVPVGAFLSGGVDSSLVVSAMARAGGRVRTFSIDFGLEQFSEGAHARRVAEIYGTEHEDLLVEPDMIPTVAESVRHAAEPFADSSAIPTYLLSQMTRASVTVALSGDGGDEAFAGYVRHRLAVLADRLDPLPRLARPLALVAARAPSSPRADRIGRGLTAVSRSRHDRYAKMLAHFDPQAIERLCRPELLAMAGSGRRAWDHTLALPEVAGVSRYAALDTATYLPGDLLLKVDRMSMAHGLEVRSPLLDHRIHELAARMPNRMKLRGSTTKWALKEIARRRGLPADLAGRAKQGFGVPVGEWCRRELRPWMEGVLRDPATRARGYFDAAEVDRLLDDHMTRSDDHGARLWNLTVLELWHRTWIDRA